MHKALAEAKRATHAGLSRAAFVAFVVLLSAASLSCAGDGEDGLGGPVNSSNSSSDPMLRTLTYAPERALLLDLHLPNPGRSTADTPVIVYFHSGGWQGGSRSEVPTFVQRQLARGFAVASVDYRLAPHHRYPSAIEDADRAVRWLRFHAGEFSLDPTRIIVAGTSAGGTIATALLAAPGAHVDANLPAELRGTSPVVQAGTIAIAPLDLVDLARNSAWGASIAAAYLGCSERGCHTETMTVKASPLAGVTVRPGPIYALFGADDDLVRAAPNADALSTAWARAGSLATVSIVGGHGFLGVVR
jgi:acetyl esterase/lipase